MKRLEIMLLFMLAFCFSSFSSAGSKNQQHTHVTIKLDQIYGNVSDARTADDNHSHITILNATYYSTVYATNRYGTAHSCTTRDPSLMSLLRMAPSDASITAYIHSTGKCEIVTVVNSSKNGPKQ